MIHLNWRGKRFSVDHPDIVGFWVHETVSVVGEKRLSPGLMRADGSLVPFWAWAPYDVRIEGEVRC